MSAFKKFGKWAKKTAGKAGKFALPLAGVGLGLALPGIGGGIGKAISAIGGKFKGAKDALGNVKKTPGFFGIGDKLPGVFGIGDAKPGVFGIGSGSDRDARLRREMELRDQYEAKKAENKAVGLPAPEVPAELKKISPLVWAAAAVAGLFILKK